MNDGTLMLNHRHWGSGKPLMILHGLFGSSMNWKSVGQHLARKWSVYALDLRNHGDSPHHPELTYPALTEDLNVFMAQQGIETAVLMGHSLGGKAIMAFADRFAQQAERLIILDIAPKPYPIAHRGMLQAMRELEVDRIRSRQEALDALAEAIPYPATRQFVLKNLVRGAGGRYRWKINLAAIDQHLHELGQGPQLQNPYPGPTLFLRGSASTYVGAEDEDLIRQYYPRATIVTVQGAGHWLHADAPSQTLHAVEEFLTSQ